MNVRQRLPKEASREYSQFYLGRSGPLIAAPAPFHLLLLRVVTVGYYRRISTNQFGTIGVAITASSADQ